MVNVDLVSSISIYTLSTVAATYQLSVDQVGVISRDSNAIGLASTVLAWHYDLLSSIL